MARRKKSSRPKRMVNYGKWWMLSEFTLQMMSYKAAIVFAYLSNFQDKCEWNEPKPLVWFFCTVPQMKKDIGMARFTQTPAIKELVKLKLIKIKKQGSPPRRYFYIDWSAMGDLYDKYCEQQQQANDDLYDS